MPEKKRRRRSKSKRFKTSLLAAFRQEVIIGVLFLLGVFLIVEDMEIKVTVYHFLVGLVQGIANLFNAMLQGIIDFFREFESSDIVGYILIFIAFVLYGNRIRNRTIERYSELPECPECGSELNRVHRNSFQKSVGTVLRVKIRRYRCKSCDFDGLRIRRMQSR